MSLSIHSHSLEIAQVLSRASLQLSNDGLRAIKRYIASQFLADGGFQNRYGESDLYYSMFGYTCALSLQVDINWEQCQKYLEQFAVQSLSMVDLACLVKCHAVLQLKRGIAVNARHCCLYLAAMEKFRTPNGSFSYDGHDPGFPYAVFLALNFYQDLGQEIPQKTQLCTAINSYRTSTGAFRNPLAVDRGMLLSTAASMLVIRQLTGKVDNLTLQWIANQQHPVGGFKNTPQAPLPDMLSTAVALFTLNICDYPLQRFFKPTRLFIADHWDENGGFNADLSDDVCDCEYTYYALLALGSLS